MNLRHLNEAFPESQGNEFKMRVVERLESERRALFVLVRIQSLRLPRLDQVGHRPAYIMDGSGMNGGEKRLQALSVLIRKSSVCPFSRTPWSLSTSTTSPTLSHRHGMPTPRRSSPTTSEVCTIVLSLPRPSIPQPRRRPRHQTRCPTRLLRLSYTCTSTTSPSLSSHSMTPTPFLPT